MEAPSDCSNAPSVMVALSEDPGAAGKFEADYYARELAGYDVRFLRETKDKITRAKPVSAQAERGNIKVVRGAWNRAFLSELEEFPEGKNDDQVDALSGAFAKILEVGDCRYDGARKVQVSRRGGGVFGRR